MKFSIPAALLVCAPLVPAASFQNGQAARAEIGQFFFNSDQGAPSNQVLAGPSGLAYANGQLWVADGNILGANDGVDGSGNAITGNRILTFYTNLIPGPYADVSAGSLGDSLCPLCGFSAANVLGQADYTSYLPGRAQTGSPGTNNNSGVGSMNAPTAVATDGVSLAVADTNNNRVLLWKAIPTVLNQAPDLVLGQVDFTSQVSLGVTNASTLKAPMGVWLQSGKLFVADTYNNRVLIWNSFPTSNNQPADVVLGEPDFSTVNNPPFTTPVSSATLLYNPVSVTSDGNHVFVADVGYNRVLIWNSIPTSNDVPADVVVGQPNMVSTAFDNVTVLCASNGTDLSGNPTYPALCERTLGAPRYALSDGKNLYIADGGNNRILLYDHIPATSGARAEGVLGQPDFTSNVQGQTSLFSSSTSNSSGSSNTFVTPMSLAYDGENLYVADLFDRRVSVFTPGDIALPANSVLNAASRLTRTEGYVALSGTIVANDTVTITIAGTAYTWTVQKADTLATIAAGLIQKINSANSNAGDPSVLALAGPSTNVIYFSSRAVNPGFDTTSLAATSSNTTDILATASGSYLTGGNAATVSPNMIVEVDYSGGQPALADGTVSAADCSSSSTTISTTVSTPLPTSLPAACNGSTPQGSVQVFMDGVATPLFMVSPNQVRAVVPYEFNNRSTASLYVRTVHPNGQITITTAQALTVAPANPGFFYDPASTLTPPPAFQPQHQSGNPSVTLLVGETTVQPGDVANVVVNGRTYTYTVVTGDTITTITDNLAAAINGDAQVTATATGAAGNILLTARVSGSAGTGIPVSGTVTAASGKTSAGITLTVENSSTCCASNNTGAITAANPALPNELVTLYGTGLGVLQSSGGQPVSVTDGAPFTGQAQNSAVTSAYVSVGGSDQNVVSDGLAQGAIGVYSVQFQIPSAAAANANTPVYMAQNQFVSNTVTIPVGSAPATQTAISASPNPVVVPTGQTTGTTILSWSTAAATNVQVVSNSGAVVGTGVSGTATVTAADGTIYYVQDASSSAQLGSVTIRVVQSSGGQPAQFSTNSCPAGDGGYWVGNTSTLFTAQPSFIQLGPGQTYGQTNLIWTVASPTVTSVGVFRSTDATHVDPNPHATGTANGQVRTSANVLDGTTFWLQDTTAGTPGTTLACLKVAVLSNELPAGHVSANPSVITSTTGSGETTISWNCAKCAAAQVRVSSADSGSIVASGTSGSVTAHAANGTIFYLLDMSNPAKPVVVSQMTVHVQLPRGRMTPRPLGPSQNRQRPNFYRGWSKIRNE